MTIALATPVISDAATITASSESAPLPVSNLLTRQPKDVWRTLALQAYATFDLGAVETVQLVWLGYTNATSSATWRVRAADSEANLTAAPGYDSGTLLQWPSPDLGDWERRHAFLWIPGPVAFQWWRIDVDNVGAAAGYFQAGRAYLSDPWSPPFGMDFGHRHGRVDASERRRANSGASYAVERGMWREIDFSISHADRDTMLKEADRIERLRGTHGDVLLMLDVGEPRFYMEQSIYGAMKTLSPIVNQGKATLQALGLTPIFSKRFHLEEMEHP